MTHYCEQCGTDRHYEFVDEYVDDRGRTIEIYRCSVCGLQMSFPVS